MVQQIPDDAPCPRLCTVVKESPGQEYGYNLHAEKGRGQFIGAVDPNSAADKAGLKPGDRIYAVNGVPISGESHKQVVQRIKQNPDQCELLVITEDGARWYQERNIPITPSLPNVIRPGREANGNAHFKGNSQSPPPAAGWYAPGVNGSKVESATTTVSAAAHAASAMTSSSNPRPRLSQLRKVNVVDEFGFNLHAEKGRGHFIGTVDKDGIGDRAGLVLGQRIVGVNGTLVYPNTPHKDVVALIKNDPMITTLLVASEEVDQWYRDNMATYSFDNCEPFHAGSSMNSVSNNHHPTTTPYMQPAYHDDGISVSSSSTGNSEGSSKAAGDHSHNAHAPDEPMHLPPTAIAAMALTHGHDDEHSTNDGEHEERQGFVMIHQEEEQHGEAMPRMQFHVGDDEQHRDDLLDRVFAGVPPPASTTRATMDSPSPATKVHHTTNSTIIYHPVGESGLAPEPIEEMHVLQRHVEMPAETLAFESSPHMREAAHMTPPAPYSSPPNDPAPMNRAAVPPAAPYHHPPAANGHRGPAANGDLQSPAGLRPNIFNLSAKEAREQLRHKKKDPRKDADMSLEEKYRVVSNM